MEEIQSSFWLTVAASSAGSTALIAIAAFLGRSQLSHWLTKDLERLKLQHQRELEAYKVTLIAQAEQAKSASEIKKAGALMVLEKKFESFTALYTTISDITYQLSILAQSGGITEKEAEQAFVHIEEFEDALSASRPFLSEQNATPLVALQDYLHNFFDGFCTPGSPVLPDHDHQMLFDVAAKAKQELIRLINGMAML